MPREPKSQSNIQLESSFGEIMNSAEVHSRQQDFAFQDYDPLATTAEYMQRAVEVEKA